jgi:hypothetical protein
MKAVLEACPKLERIKLMVDTPFSKLVSRQVGLYMSYTTDRRCLLPPKAWHVATPEHITTPVVHRGYPSQTYTWSRGAASVDFGIAFCISRVHQTLRLY